MLPIGAHPVPPHNLPRLLTPLVGRATELAEIGKQLADPVCSLLTLSGPGGIGKTRLAVEAATAIVRSAATDAPTEPTTDPASAFVDGVFVVNLQPLTHADLVALAIADVLGLHQSGADEAVEHLMRHLADKQMLLVLDNFEQLLPTGADLLTRLLEVAPRLKLLVTSRERLSLVEEWVYPVQGLSYPTSAAVDPVAPTPSAGQIEQSAAVQLFMERGRRVRRDLALDQEGADILSICQMVEGSPLAIELAAAWSRSMPTAQIAAEIRRNLDFLSTNLRNVPERHRNMQAVFTHSWRLLSGAEQAVFQRLSVFSGGFTRQAAEQVAGASLATLSALVDKSLLRWDAEGIYQIHELLRQFGQEQLDQTPGAARQVRAAHCDYYSRHFHGLEDLHYGPHRRQVMAQIATEFDNVRQAWSWAIETGNAQSIGRMVYLVQDYYDARGRYGEALTMLGMAVHRLEQLPETGEMLQSLAAVLNFLGYTQLRNGHLEEARTNLARSQALYDRLQTTPSAGFGTNPLVGLGILANTEGRYAEASAIGAQLRQQFEQQPDSFSLTAAYYILANAALAQGEYEGAAEAAQQAHRLAQATGNHYFQAYTLNDLGNVALAQGDYAGARHCFQQSYTLRSESQDPEGMAVTLTLLARTAWHEQDFTQAEQLYRQSLDIYREIDDQGGLARALLGLGETALAVRNLPVARHCFDEALTTTVGMKFWPLCLNILTGIGELWLHEGHDVQGTELLTVTAHHPATDYETRKRALARLDRSATNKATDKSLATHKADDIEVNGQLAAVAQRALATLAGSRQVDGDVSPALAATPPDQPLIEPLTERELQVLHLIAAGLTNAEIAEQLIIAIGTVKSYTGNIYGKLGVRSRTQAVARARELALLSDHN
jgi:predicted ATPase/DNA-binding CsgD family transcriptional regulator